MQSLLSDVLSRRKNRAIAIILGVKERECDGQLSKLSADALRKVVLDQFNEFYDFAVDVLRSYDGTTGVVLNEIYLEKLDTMHDILIARRED